MMRDLKNRVMILGALRGFTGISRVLEKAGKRVGRSPAGVGFTTLREGEEGDRLAIQGYAERFPSVVALLVGRVKLPEVRGHLWRSDRLGPFEVIRLEKRRPEPEGMGDWRLPRPNREGVGWRPTTFVPLKVLKELPEEMLERVRVRFSPNEPWWGQRLARYVQVGDLGKKDRYGNQVLEPITWEKVGGKWAARAFEFLTGPEVVGLCPDSESFLIEVSGWPLKYVPLTYLGWLVGDGWFQRWKESSIPGVKTYTWEFQPCAGVLRQKIVEWLRLPENDDGGFDPFREELESRDFYGTGVWVQGWSKVPLEEWWEDRVVAYSPDAGGKLVKKRARVRVSNQQEVQKFLDLGTSRQNRWGASGISRVQVYEGGREDEDPGPGDVELGLTGKGVRDRWQDHGRHFLEDWKPKGPPRHPEEVWRRLIRLQAWAERTRKDLERTWFKGQKRNGRDWWLLRQDLAEAGWQLELGYEEVEKDLLPCLQRDEPLEWALQELEGVRKARKGIREGQAPPEEDLASEGHPEATEREKVHGPWPYEARNKSYTRPGGGQLPLEKALGWARKVARRQVDSYEDWLRQKWERELVPI